MTDHAALAANQFVAEADARTADIKVDLHLTPDQDKNSAGFESSLHDIEKNRADRVVALQDERGQWIGNCDRARGRMMSVLLDRGHETK
jgi:hypothetical protein